MKTRSEITRAFKVEPLYTVASSVLDFFVAIPFRLIFYLSIFSSVSGNCP